MTEIIQPVKGVYLKLITTLRRYFAESQSKEQLNDRLRIFYRVLSPLFLNNGPRRKQNQDVVERLTFLKQELKPGMAVIDVGCFDGYFCEKLREYGCNMTGVDSLDLVLKQTRKDDPNGLYHKAFAEDLPFSDNQFDAGIYSHVLEHISDPWSAMHEAKRVIRPRGKLVVVVPFDLGIDANHLREYSKEDLEQLVAPYFINLTYHSSIGNAHGITAINPTGSC